MNSIPLADAQVLQRRARLTFLTRSAFAVVAAGLAVAFTLAARHPHTKALPHLPVQADTVLVLDLSASISDDTFSRMGGTLDAISRSGARVGLVGFSDQAYEALPPGTPAADLAPLVRYFTPAPRNERIFGLSGPQNPWQNTFTGGTRISAGMALARRLAASAPRRPTVMLVSDLDDNPADKTRLASVLLALRRDRVPVQIVGLKPATADVAFFQRLLGPSASLTLAPTLARVQRDRAPFPWALVVLTAAAAAALALRELWAPRLEWGGP